MAVRRTQEQKLATIDAKIDYHKQHLDRLSQEREVVLNPPAAKERVRKTSMKKALDAIKEIGLTPDEILALAAKAKKAKDKEKE